MEKHPLLGEDSTTARLSDDPSRRGQWWRWAGVALLVAIMLAATVGLLGPRTAETSATARGYQLDVTYPQVTRAGQPAPLHVRITAEAGFGETVQVSACDGIFDNFDFQNWYPNPSAETSTPTEVVYEFDAPVSGNTLEVSLDARSAPGQFGGIRDCEISVLEDDRPVVSTAFTTWRMP